MTTFNRVNDGIGFHFNEVKLCISSPIPKIHLARSLSHIKKKKNPERNKFFFFKAKSEITFKSIARQKEMEVGKDTEVGTREY